MRRVMVPHNLLVWVEVDLDDEKVVDVYACDYPENYWPDKEFVTDAGHAKALRNLDDWQDEGEDPVDDELSNRAGRIVDDANDWPRLRIEDAYR